MIDTQPDLSQTLQDELRQGSEKALSKVFSEYYTLLCSIAYQYVNDIQESEAIAVDCFTSTSHAWRATAASTT